MHLKKLFLTGLVAPLIFASSLAQGGGAKTSVQNVELPNNAQPENGKAMPWFELTDVHYFPKKKVDLSDFKGKWLIMDFWFSSCVACIKSFPHMNDLQKKFGDKLQVILVGVLDSTTAGQSKNATRSLFDRLRVKQKLEIPCAYDYELSPRWDIYRMPHVIIVNPEGIVYSVNKGVDVTEEKIAAMITGKKVNFLENQQLVNYEPKVDTASTIYTSEIKKWKNESPNAFSIPEFVEAAAKNEIEGPIKGSMLPLQCLYNLAHTGYLFPGMFSGAPLFKDFHPRAVLEVADSTNFRVDYKLGILNLFNYAIFLPKTTLTTEAVMGVLRNDLEQAFPYTSKVEKRMMPIWKLTAAPGAAEKLKSKGDKPYFSDSSYSMGAGFKAKRIWGKDLAVFTTRFLGLEDPLIDEAGLPEFIDIEIDALMSDYNQVRRELKKYGLDLIKSEELLNVVVIRDKVSAK